MTSPGTEADRRTDQAGMTPAGMASWDQWPPVAYVETDRYCEHCGYNLRTQAVRREPHTRILLARCPECGRFHAVADATSATKLWLRRLTTLLLVVWIGMIGGGCLSTLALEGFLIGATLDDLTSYDYSAWQSKQTYVPPRLVVRDGIEPRQLRWILGLCGTASLLLGFFAAFVAVVVFPHWRRALYLVPALGGPALVAGLALFFWRMNALHYDSPELVGWSLPYIGGYMAAQMLGGLIGVGIGRPLARGIVRAFLTPRLRAPFAYLWLADGRTPPGG